MFLLTSVKFKIGTHQSIRDCLNAIYENVDNSLTSFCCIQRLTSESPSFVVFTQITDFL